MHTLYTDIQIDFLQRFYLPENEHIYTQMHVQHTEYTTNTHQTAHAYRSQIYNNSILFACALAHFVRSRFKQSARLKSITILCRFFVWNFWVTPHIRSITSKILKLHAFLLFHRMSVFPCIKPKLTLLDSALSAKTAVLKKVMNRYFPYNSFFS